MSSDREEFRLLEAEESTGLISGIFGPNLPEWRVVSNVNLVPILRPSPYTSYYEC